MEASFSAKSRLTVLPQCLTVTLGGAAEAICGVTEYGHIQNSGARGQLLEAPSARQLGFVHKTPSPKHGLLELQQPNFEGQKAVIDSSHQGCMGTNSGQRVLAKPADQRVSINPDVWNL